MKKTWLAALNRGEYWDWPGLTAELVSKHLPQDTKETAAGHLQRRRQGVQSTNKPTTNTIKALEPIDSEPATLNKDRTQAVGVHIVSPTELNGTISVDQTRKFLKISATGKQYIMVLYNYDTNGIATFCFPFCCSKKALLKLGKGLGSTNSTQLQATLTAHLDGNSQKNTSEKTHDYFHLKGIF